MQINDFEFQAFCLLGTAEPCYEGSELITFDLDNFQAKMDQMLSDYRESFNLVNTSNDVDNTHPNENLTEGGETVLDEQNKFNNEEVNEPEAAPVSESEVKPANEEETQNFELTSNQTEELQTAFENGETISEYFGDFPRYCFVDYDHEAGIVYAYDRSDWKLYGFTYSFDNDNAVVNFDSKTRKKFAIVDFNEGDADQTNPVEDIFALAKDAINENASFKEQYQSASGQIEMLTSELDELRKFKNDCEHEAMVAKKDGIFAKFENLAGIEAFENLKENWEQYDLATLEEKCYAIQGMNLQTANFSLSEKKNVWNVKNYSKENDSKYEPYGGIFKKYGIVADE